MRVAILEYANPNLAADTSRLATTLRLQSVTVNLIACTVKQRFDALILPDTGGFDCTSSAFYPHSKYPPNHPGQDQAMQFFTKYTLDWYIKKKIPILGIGSGGLIIWSEVLRNKLDYVIKDGSIEPFHMSDTTKELMEFPDSQTGDWSFFVGIYAGLPQEPEYEDYYEILSRLIRQADGPGRLATVPVPLTPAPLTLTETAVEAPPLP